MKTIFDSEAATEIRTRMKEIHMSSARLFGSMTAPQMVNHLNVAFEAYLGRRGMTFNNNWLWATISKWIAFSPLPMPRGRIKLPKQYESNGDYDLTAEKERFTQLLEEYRAHASSTDWPQHYYLGPLTAEQYGQLAYKHIDHHLKQFGV